MFENRATLWAVVLGLVGGAFVFGMEVGEGSLPFSPQVANVIGVERDALTTSVASTSDPVDFSLYWKVWGELDRKFIPFGTSSDQLISEEDRLYNSIEGLVEGYSDPYTIFMRPQASSDFKVATRGSLEGIGAIVGEREGKLIVIQPLEGSPAEKAGLVFEDHIQSIDGQSTEGVSVEDAVNKIRGVGGSEVVLMVQSKDQEVREVRITRGTIEIPSTAHAVVERDVPIASASEGDDGTSTSTDGSVDDAPVQTEKRDFYLLRLFSFSQTSVASFEKELRDFKESDGNELIIDLRGNPGGYLEAAVDMAGWFLPDGAVVVREFRGPEKREIVHRTRHKALFEGAMPNIVVVVDQASASASEILAGALKEHGVATVVGVNTYGKGSVQELIDITPELSLKVTVARWYTPNGLSISPGGLTPDVMVEVENASSSDPYIDAAIEHLSAL